MTLEQLTRVEIYKTTADLVATVEPLPFALRFRRTPSGNLVCLGRSKTYPTAERIDPLDCDPELLDADDFNRIFAELEKEIQKGARQ